MTDEPQSHLSDVVPVPEAPNAEPSPSDVAPSVAAAEPIAAISASPSISGGSSAPVVMQQSARPMTPIPLMLKSWPVVDSLGEFLFLAAIVLGTPILIFNFLGPISSAVVAAALVVVSWKHFVPTQYELSALGINVFRLGRSRRIPWMSIDRYLVGRKGVLLSSSGAPLERFRGLYLPWGKNRDLLLTTLRYYLPRAEESLE